MISDIDVIDKNIKAIKKYTEFIYDNIEEIISDIKDIERMLKCLEIAKENLKNDN